MAKSAAERKRKQREKMKKDNVYGVYLESKRNIHRNIDI